MTTSEQLNQMKPGRRITWTQITADGTEVTRSGEVWALAPLAHAGCATVWAIPDEPLDTDYYHAVAVCRARKGIRLYTGRMRHSEWSPAGGRRIEAGELFAENNAMTKTGALAAAAMHHAARVNREAA